MLQLEAKYVDVLRDIVKNNVDTRIWQPVIFGSRATGRAQKFSDIDLGFVGSHPLPVHIQAALWEALDQSDIPYVVDIVDLGTTSSDFRKLAQQGMVRLI